MATLKHWFFPVILLVLLSYLPTSIAPKENLPSSAPTYNCIQLLKTIDSEFSFRAVGFYLQHLGDTEGKRPSLTDYNYQSLYHWFKAADQLNDYSDLMPFLALFYYGNTPILIDQEWMKRFVKEHALKHPFTKQRWLKLT